MTAPTRVLVMEWDLSRRNRYKLALRDTWAELTIATGVESATAHFQSDPPYQLVVLHGEARLSGALAVATPDDPVQPLLATRLADVFKHAGGSQGFNGLIYGVSGLAAYRHILRREPAFHQVVSYEQLFGTDGILRDAVRQYAA